MGSTRVARQARPSHGASGSPCAAAPSTEASCRMSTLLRPSPLAESWLAEAMARCAIGPARADRLAQGLAKRYRERWRHYHTLDHVVTMFSLAARHRDALADPAAFALAIWYHDAVYRPRRSDNEARSAELLIKDCSPEATADPLVVPAMAPSVATASRLILATAGHQAPEDLPDGPLFLDIDLAILGAPAEAYRHYADQIRLEFRWVPGALYRIKRAEVLQRFLDRPRIFQTAEFAGLEGPARRNLAAEIASYR